MLRLASIALLALPIGAQTPPVSGPVVGALAGLDPVELTRGREVDGDPGRTLDHGRYRYRFANAENLATFAQDPERFGIQLGGGCAGMGPLAGVGRPDLFAVHDGRIWIFASESCRQRFLHAPDRQVDRDDPPATGDDAAAKAAQGLLDRAAAAFGGTERIDGLKALAMRRTESATWQGRSYSTGSALILAAPDRIRRESWWDEWHRVDVVVGERGTVTETGTEPAGTWPHAPSQARALRRFAERLPIVVLRARRLDDFAAFRSGDGKVGDRSVELVTCSFLGTTTVLGIDSGDGPDGGRVLSVDYDDRLPETPRGHVHVTFDDFRDVNGLMLPFRVTTTLDDRAPVVQQWSSIEVDPELDPSVFSEPD